MDVRHRTLQKYTGLPVLDENQLFYLLVPFLMGKSGNKMNEKLQSLLELCMQP